MFSKLIKPLYNKGLTLNVKRFFDLHEYQSKDVMRRFGVLVQKGDIATTPEQAEQVAQQLNVKDGILVLKAQVQAGGRGKGIYYSYQRPVNVWNERWCSNIKNSTISQIENQNDAWLQLDYPSNNQIRPQS